MKTLVLTILLAGGLSFGASTKNAAIQGYVLSFDNESIVMESGDSDVRVPRKFYPGPMKIGERLQVPMTDADVANALKNAKPSKLRTTTK